MADDNGLGKGLIIGFFTGSLVGAVVALLYAPKSGKELRGEIKEKSGEFFDEAEEYIEKAKTRASQLINDGKKKSEVLVADAKEKVDALLKEAEKVLKDAKAGDYMKEGKSKVEKEGDKLKSAIRAGIDTYKSEKES